MRITTCRHQPINRDVTGLIPGDEKIDLSGGPRVMAGLGSAIHEFAAAIKKVVGGRPPASAGAGSACPRAALWADPGAGHVRTCYKLTTACALPARIPCTCTGQPWWRHAVPRPPARRLSPRERHNSRLSEIDP